MRGAETCGRQSSPLCIEPECGKVGQHSSQPTRQQAQNVLDDDRRWSEHADGSGKRWPEPSIVIRTESLSGLANGLAGEASADNVHWGECLRVECSDIVKPLSVWPVASQHSTAVFVALDLPEHRAEAGAREAQIEATDARKE